MKLGENDLGSVYEKHLEYMIEEGLKIRKDARGDLEWGLILAFGPGITFEGILARNLCA